MPERKKRVLLGVTGCIAAYKACEILRGLQKADVDVRVVMTDSAKQFISPNTFYALSGHEVGCSLFNQLGNPIPHIEFTRDVDAFLIAPATANTIAKIANGIADDLLTSSVLANVSPLIVAPAMNVNMYNNPVTQENIERIKGRGVLIIDAQNGYLACGDIGRGKLAEVDDIVEYTLGVINSKTNNANSNVKDLQGLHVLITAGPTVEHIDPVRYLSNPSTGKMGYEIANAAHKRGANVTLVSGPTTLEAPDGVHIIRVRSANEMLKATSSVFDKSDIAIFTAAVSDMRPEKTFDRKLKKGEDTYELKEIKLVENPDILATLSKVKTNKQVCIGFAAETNNVVENARKKLISKSADMIVGNKIDDNVGFGSVDIDAVFVTNNETISIDRTTKPILADKILTKAMDIKG